MKMFAVLPLAATLAVGLATAAQAWTVPSSYDYDIPAFVPAYEHVATDQWHPLGDCVGLHSGTAHHSCRGTLTGGPSGGIN